MYKALKLLWGCFMQKWTNVSSHILYNFDKFLKLEWQDLKVLVLVHDGTIDIMTFSSSSSSSTTTTTTTTIPTATLAHGTPSFVSMTCWFFPHWDDCRFVIAITAWWGWTLVSTRSRALRAVATMVWARRGGFIWGRGRVLDLVELQLKWSSAVRRGVGGSNGLGATPNTPAGFACITCLILKVRLASCGHTSVVHIAVGVNHPGFPDDLRDG